MIGQPNKKEELVGDLVYLRKRSGLTTGRMRNASTLVEVCGGRDQPVEITRARLVSAIESLPDTTRRDALLAAYGLLSETRDLASLALRRAAYGSQVGRKYDTIANREDSAIEELAIRLLTGYYAGAPLLVSLPVPHGGYLLEFLNVTTVYRDRLFAEHEQERRIISLVDGAQTFRYHSSDEGSNGRSHVTAVHGCTVDTEYVSGGSLHTLTFPKPLMRGETHDFAFREALEDPATQSEVPAEDFAGQSFETPTLIYRQDVTFLGEKPEVIWAYDKLSRVERPGEPAAGQVLEIEHGGYLRHEFSQLYGGLSSGVAWRWSDRDKAELIASGEEART